MSRNLERSEWQEYICEDLQPVLRWLDEQHNIHITEIVFDMKGIYTCIYTDTPLTKELAEEAKVEFPANARLRFEKGWFGCTQDFTSIEASKRDDQDVVGNSLLDRMKNLFS
jgi:hypothetical protein